MAIFWGFGSKSKNPDELWVPYYCSSCSKLSSFAVTENYKYGQVYGIRLAKYKAKYFLVCHVCDRVLVIDGKEEFITAQNIGRTIKGTSSENFDSMKFMKDVARWVLKNPEMVKLLEKMENDEISNEEEQPQLASGEPDSKVCPDCAETVKMAAKKCRFCQYEF